MYKRAELQALRERVLEPRKFIQVVTGPRQVGKTTLVSQLYDENVIPAKYISADNQSVGTYNWIEQVWESARLKIRNEKLENFLLIIDEIQKVSNWSEQVKRLWDEDSLNKTPLKIILLGSSRLLMQQGLTESLAGRFEVLYLSHWSFLEMNEAFGWDANKYAWFGGYPGSVDLINDEARWKKYIRDSLIETSISKDILMLSRIDKPALLKKLFEIGCLYTGQILSFTKLQGQLQDAGNTTTLSHYLKLLDTAGLLAGIEKFSGTIIRQRSSSPKFQVYNNALLSAQDDKIFDEVYNNPGEWGRIVESVVGSHLINNSIREEYNLFYWRDRSNEVDYVIEKNNKIIAIEVKSNISKDKKGMNEFVKRFNPDKTYLIDKRGLRWEEFIGINPLEMF